MKLQTAGGAKEIMVRKVKAVPIKMAAPEIYESLSRGTIDGGTLGMGSILSYNLPGSAKFVTIGENFGSIVAVYGISEARWKRLPENVRKVMQEAGEAANRNMCVIADKGVETDYEVGHANVLRPAWTLALRRESCCRDPLSSIFQWPDFWGI